NDQMAAGRKPPAATPGRNSDAPLIIFLVGENPTTGIDKQTFLAALQMRRDCLLLESNKEIRIVGPYFSGSQSSLAAAIKSWSTENTHDRFAIISGGATGIRIEKNEENTVLAGVPQARFAATVAPQDVLLYASLVYLTNMSASTESDLKEFD